MVLEIDPKHSRLFDVHRWSDYPRVNERVNVLWEELALEADLRKPGPKPKRSPKDMFKVLLLDLYVAWRTDPLLSLGIHFDRNKWAVGSRYNALFLSKKILEYVELLEQVKLIDVSKGSYSGPGAASNRISRIRATPLLAQIFARWEVDPVHIGHAKDRECIILRDVNGRDVEYEDTDETNQMRKELSAYNALLERTFIDLPDVEEDYVEREVHEGQRAGGTAKVPIFPSNKFVRRVFSRERWDLNGRFYGGWWQQIDSKQRRSIHLNGIPTVEVDFKAMHVNIFSLERGQLLDGDPYDITDEYLDGVASGAQRKYLKHLILTAINARDRKSAFKAFRDNYPPGDRGRQFTDEELERLMEVFLEKTPQLADAMFNDEGIRLMNLDAQIAAGVLRDATAVGEPVLSVHDSFIIRYDRVKYLKSLMERHSQLILGKALPAASDLLGLDEVNADRAYDYRDLRRIEPTNGSRERRRRFEGKDSLSSFHAEWA